MLVFIIFYLTIMANFQLVFTGNILFLSPLPSRSHYLWNNVIAVELVNRGHNVTFLSADNDMFNGTLANYTSIQLEGVYKYIDDNINPNEFYNVGIWAMLTVLHQYSRLICQSALMADGLKQLNNYPKHFQFDLIINDISLSYCLNPLIERFNYPPTIGITAFLLPSYISYGIGNSLYSSYLPHVSVHWSDNMTFYQRLLNFLITRYDLYLRYTQLYPDDELLARQVFGDNNQAKWYQLERHIQLILANTDPLFDYPQPLPPNIISIAGVHLSNTSIIPTEYQRILDNAKNGVIVFSLGTTIRSDKLNDKQRRIFLEAFSRLKELIIWKYETDLDDLPENVIIRKWLPQKHILAHPNVKLFMGHGGISSTQEAIYHQVPMILIPFIVDQHVNAKRIAQRQLGCVINVGQLSVDYVYGKIREIIDNPIYVENVKKTSQRFRHRSQTPLERAIFWIEYMMKYGGSDDFLSTKSRDMPHYQATEIDVVLFLVLMLLVSIIVSIKLTEKLLQLIL